MSSVIGNDLLSERAQELITLLRNHSLMLATAESCTGGLLSALITDIPGSSDVFDRGFVTYSNDAKAGMLGLPMALIEKHGAVSSEVARSMAMGALENSGAQISVSITGIAGPGGGTQGKPVGLVHFAACGISHDTPAPRCNTIERQFGDIGRAQVRFEAVRVALEITNAMIDEIVGDIAAD